MVDSNPTPRRVRLTSVGVPRTMQEAVVLDSSEDGALRLALDDGRVLTLDSEGRQTSCDGKPCDPANSRIRAVSDLD